MGQENVLNPLTGRFDLINVQTETDPIWSDDKPNYQTTLQADAKYLQDEIDPHSLHLDQTTPQTMTIGGGTGLISLTAGVVGLDTTTYLDTTTAGTTYVPYTGASSDVNLGTHSFTTSGISISKISDSNNELSVSLASVTSSVAPYNDVVFYSSPNNNNNLYNSARIRSGWNTNTYGNNTLVFGTATANGVFSDQLYLKNGAVYIDGGYFTKITTVTDTYNVLSTDFLVVCNKATDFTVTLPTAVVGQVFRIKNIGAGAVTLDGTGTDTIDGSETYPLSQYASVTIQCLASNTWGTI